MTDSDSPTILKRLAGLSVFIGAVLELLPYVVLLSSAPGVLSSPPTSIVPAISSLGTVTVGSVTIYYSALGFLVLGLLLYAASRRGEI